MARRPRADRPGSWHHVINRGIAKRALFESRDDARFFLARLVRQVRLGRIEIHAFCIMTTHFHLLVRSPLGELSEALRRAQNEHSRRFNRMRRRDGALVRGRYFSKPVRSLQYRRVLVRYIDSNPLKSGLARSVGDALGSAAAYLGHTHPPWLTRKWVEAEACRAAGVETFSPEAYRTAFGARDAVEIEEIHEFVDARSARSTEEDPLGELVGAAPKHVQAWMQRKAELADGHRVGLPVCGRRTLRLALDEHLAERGLWMVEDGRNTWRGADLAWLGLLRDLCGFTWREIAQLDHGSVPRARRLGIEHWRLLRSDPDYARRVADIAQVAIERGSGR